MNADPGGLLCQDVAQTIIESLDCVALRLDPSYCRFKLGRPTDQTRQST